MTQPRPELHPPIRTVDGLPAEAPWIAREVGDTRLIEKVDKSWKV